MLEAIVRFLAGFVPEHTADPEVQYRYLLRLGLTVTALLVAGAAITLTAFGIVPAWSEGFAHTTDLKSLVQEMRTNRAQTIDNQLLELRIKHCQAKSEEARQLYWQKIAPLLQEYQQLTGRQYYLPSCADL